MDRSAFVQKLQHRWATDPRWAGITRPYTADDVWRLRGTVEIEHSLARQGAARLWRLLEEPGCVAALSAMTGNQAVQEVRAGLKAVYLSGWQVAGDMNDAAQIYPDQSLYPSSSVPNLIRRLNNALIRADQIHHLAGDDSIHWMAPIVADAEAGFGGAPHAFELMKAMIEEGAAGVHFEDQLSSVKKCGHLGGKVVVPTREFVAKLVAARLAADVCGVDTILIARTDALSANILANDIDPYDRPFLTGERTHEGFHYVRCGLEAAVARGWAYAPYADMIWCETATPDLGEAREFAAGIHEKVPGKPLAYNCSPSFNWKKHLTSEQIEGFREELAAMGYKFQFVTLSAFHANNLGMFTLAVEYRDRGMAGYAALQSREFDAEREGYEALKHQSFVGAGYFDEITTLVTGGHSSTLAMEGSTEAAQFTEVVHPKHRVPGTRMTPPSRV
ncbi:MAG TPA: isocitrate lyase [Gemmatimonadales bacterium]|nr:isocitrate lyase [Gemmatimonadales bacterium]